MKQYQVNEIFYSVQGEGVRSGTANVFIRFSGCNLTCNEREMGFDCDTEFVSGRKMTAKQIIDESLAIAPECRWIILTGGEPALQIDDELIQTFKEAGYELAIETNGTKELPQGLDWITVSPKTAEHTLRQPTANEVKYVRQKGQGIPRPTIKADHYLISPAHNASNGFAKETMQWCVDLVKDNPEWRLSLQLHKILSVR
jgi:organic radical activating enzyme